MRLVMLQDAITEDGCQVPNDCTCRAGPVPGCINGRKANGVLRGAVLLWNLLTGWEFKWKRQEVRRPKKIAIEMTIHYVRA